MTQQNSAHRITFEESPGTARVVFNGEVIAETANAIVLKEGTLPPVYYIPPGDVQQNLLSKTTRSSHCPFKGDASYWTIKVGDKEAQNAVWAYENPFDQVARIKDHMAFYADQMDDYVTG